MLDDVLAFLCMLAAVVLVAAMVIGGCQLAEPGAASVASPSVTATAAPPPCIHEACTERPVRLRCYRESNYFCREYAIDYERHCVCDQWGPAPVEADAQKGAGR